MNWLMVFVFRSKIYKNPFFSFQNIKFLVWEPVRKEPWTASKVFPWKAKNILLKWKTNRIFMMKREALTLMSTGTSKASKQANDTISKQKFLSVFVVVQFDVCCVFVHSHSTRAQRNILMMFKIYVHTRSSISRVYKQHIFDTCCCCFHSVRALFFLLSLSFSVCYCFNGSKFVELTNIRVSISEDGAAISTEMETSIPVATHFWINIKF